MLKGKLYLNNQECESIYNFSSVNISEMYMTQGFANKFGDEAKEIYAEALRLVTQKYHNTADYLQTFVYELGEDKEEKIRFWLMLDDYGNDVWVITALLPDEY